MQQSVKQHRAMTVRNHETIAIRPILDFRAMVQVLPPEHLGNLGLPMASQGGLSWLAERRPSPGRGSHCTDRKGLAIAGVTR